MRKRQLCRIFQLQNIVIGLWWGSGLSVTLLFLQNCPLDVLFGKKCNGAGVSTIILIVGQWHDWTINKYQGIPGVRHSGKRWRLDTSLKPACTYLVEQWHVAKTVGVIRESGGSGYSATWWLNSKESGGNLVALRLLSLSADRCVGKINQTNKVVDTLFLEYTLY